MAEVRQGRLGVVAHRLVGLGAFLAFIATGVYLKLGPGAGGEPADPVRFIYRANHVYLLASALLNAAVGLYAVAPQRPWRRRMQQAGSLLLLAAPAVLLAAFVLEPPKQTLHRPLTSVGVIMLVVAIALHLPARRRHVPNT